MRIFILIALLISFTVVSFDTSASAAIDYYNCAQEMAEDNQADPCHSEQEKKHDHEQCDDCLTCCSHSQSMTVPAVTPHDLSLKSGARFIVQAEHLPSFNPQGLKRPPRL